mgnify:CR=1 FL=1
MTRIFSRSGEGYRIDPEGYLRVALCLVAVGLALYIAWYALFAPTDRHFHGAVFFTTMLPIVFLTTTASKAISRITKVDYFLAAVSLGAGLYYILNAEFYRNIVEGITPVSDIEKALGVFTVALSVEACRRTIGWGLTGVVVVLIAYVTLGHLLTGGLYHPEISVEYFVLMQTVTDNGIFSIPIQVAATYAFLFVLFGSFYQRAGGGQFFFDVAAAIAGRTRGGPAKACVVSSGLYGSVSGSPVADVVTTGPITIPLMRQVGISARRAAAIESAASGGGALLPPVMGAVAFLMVEYTGIPYHEVVVAGVISALLYYLGVFVLIHFEAQRFGEEPLADDKIVSLTTAVLKGWVQLIPILILVALLIKGYTVPYIAAGATISVIVASWLSRNPNLRIGPKAFVECCFDTMFRMVVLAGAVIAAGLIIGCIDLSGLTGKFSLMMFHIAGDNIVLALIASAVVLILLGMGMPTPGVYIMGVALLAPVLVVNFELATLQTHMFMLYIACMSSITPPLAVACFAAGTIAGANPMAIAVYAVKLGVAGFILPFYFAFNPGVLFVGGVSDIILATGIGIVLIATSAFTVHGWVYTRPVAWWFRIALGGLCIGMIYPQIEIQILAAVCAILGVGGAFQRLKTPLA